MLALDRGRVRQRFETRFSAARMAQEYVAIYRRLLRAPAPAELRAHPIVLPPTDLNGHAEDQIEPDNSYPTP